MIRKTKIGFIIMLVMLLAFSASVLAEDRIIDTYFDWAEAMIGLDMTHTAELLLTYMDNNPEATQVQLEEYLMQLITTNSINLDTSIQAFGQSPIPGSPGDMRTHTRAVFNSNPVWGALALSDGRAADTVANRRWDEISLHNGNGDAFRHALWNGYMMISIRNSNFVDRFATAWEDDGDAYRSQPSIERLMDITNNRRGLNIGANNPNAAPMQIEQLIKNATINGEFVRIINNRLVNTNREGSIR